MSAITRKVEWVKLRELSASEQDLVRKRYSLRGKRMNTQKVQVIYTDGRIDSHHAPDCHWPSNEVMRGFREGELDESQLAWAAGRTQMEVEFDVGEASSPAVIYIPAPCTCGVIQTEAWDFETDAPAEARLQVLTLTKYVRSHLGLFATRGTPNVRVRRKGELPTLIRFVPRPLNFDAALEFGEVEDLGAMNVLADALLEAGNPLGKRIALALHKFRQEESAA